MNSSPSIATLAAALVKAQAIGDPHQESPLVVALTRETHPLRVRYKENLGTVFSRFFEKIAFGASECWYWRGSLNRLGYGCMLAMGESKAHRISYRLFHGPIEPGKFILHRCDVRNCVNPDHLYIGDRKDNARDKYRRQRDTSSDLSQDQVREIKAALFNYKLGMCKDLAAKYGVSPGVISDIRLGHTFRHVESAADSRTEEPK